MAPLLNTAFVLSMAAGGLAVTLPARTGKGLVSKPTKRVPVGAAVHTLPAIRAHAAVGSSSSSASSTWTGVGPGPGPEYLTISIVNSHGYAISTDHHSDPNGPAPTGVNQLGPGTIAAGSSATFAVPTGWIGNVAVVDARYNITNSDTLVEANYVIPEGYNHAVADVDISYVNGYTMAMTCSCSGKVVSGCNKDLSKLGTCPAQDKNGEGGCANPLRADEGATEAAPFFAPCQHAAWTYVNDGRADAWGACQSGQIVCCAGTACPANPNQAGDLDNNNSTAPPPSSGMKDEPDNKNHNGTAPSPSSGEKHYVGAAASSQSSSAAAPVRTFISLPGLPSLSLPALPFSFSRPVFASLSLPVTFQPSGASPAMPVLSLSLPAGVTLPAGVSLPTAMQPAATTALRT